MIYDKLIERLRECTAEMNGEKTLWHQAADAIEDLENRLNLWRQDKIRRWIPVTERLPEVGKKVLVFAYGNDTLTARMQKRTENGHPVFECNGIFLEMAKLGRITHWMPLPESPESDGE